MNTVSKEWWDDLDWETLENERTVEELEILDFFISAKRADGNTDSAILLVRCLDRASWIDWQYHQVEDFIALLRELNAY